jgi:hypothetical protein
MGVNSTEFISHIKNHEFCLKYDTNTNTLSCNIYVTKEKRAGAVLATRKVDNNKLINLTPSAHLFLQLKKKLKNHDTITRYISERDKSLDKFLMRLEESLESIQIQYGDWLDDADERRQLEAEVKNEEEKEKLFQEAMQFKQFLGEHNLTFFEYLTYLSKWFSGAEYENVIIGFLCTFGTFSGVKPLWFMAVGKAGEGKSFIEDGTLELTPDKFLENGLKTEKAVVRKGRICGIDYLDHMILTMGDLGGPKDFEEYKLVMHKYKKMTTEGHDEFEAVSDNADPETKEREIIFMELKGYPSVMFTTVDSENIDPQFASRGITVTPRASNHDASIYTMYNQRGSIWEAKTSELSNTTLKLFHSYVESLDYEDIGVINPYYLCLVKWFRDDEYFKRGLGKYPELVHLITYLNSGERETIQIDDRRFYVSTKDDNTILTRLIRPDNSLSGVAVDVFNQLLKYYKKFDYDEYVEYEAKDIRLDECETFFSVGSARKKLRNNRRFRGLQYADILFNLDQAGLLVKVGKELRGNTNLYCLDKNTPVENHEIEFDDGLIKEYIDNKVEGIYGGGLTPHLLQIMGDEKPVKGIPSSFSDLEIPPWFNEGGLEEGLNHGKGGFEGGDENGQRIFGK